VWNLESEDPRVEEALQIPVRRPLHHLAEVIGAGLLELPLLVEARTPPKNASSPMRRRSMCSTIAPLL
jgi:hypothetical protein